MDNKKSGDIIGMAEELFKKLPPLPANAVASLVKYMPWIVLVFGVIGILIGLAGLRAFAAFSAFVSMTGAQNAYGLGFISAVVLIGSGVLMLLSYPGLKSQKLNGWNLLFWSEVLGLAGYIFQISIVGIAFSLVGFYILFQIKPKYK